MSLNKAIEHRKEKRKPYRGWKAWAKSCRNHGSDPWFKENRLHSRVRRERAIDDDIKEWKNSKPIYLGTFFVDGNSDEEFWNEWFLFDCDLDELLEDLFD